MCLTIPLVCNKSAHTTVLDLKENALFDIDLIRNPIKGKKLLISPAGFESISFKTRDNITLNGLYKTHPEAQATLIFSYGLKPHAGRCAPYYALLADLPYNFLLIDGRFQYQKNVIERIFTFGCQEHEDLIGAITYAHLHSDKPIILHGTCTAGFAVLKTLIILAQDPSLSYLPVIGAIIDSGWASRSDIVHNASRYILKHKINRAFNLNSNNRKDIEESITYKITQGLGNTAHSIGYTLFGWPWFSLQKKKYDIANQLSSIKVPVHIIHAKDDKTIPIAHVEKIINILRYPSLWIVPNSSHNKNHFNHPTTYKHSCIDFFQQCLKQHTV